MLDRQTIRQNPEAVKAGARKKHIEAPVDALVAMDAERRNLLVQLESLRAELNASSKAIGQLMGQGKREEAEEAKATTRSIKDKIEGLEVQTKATEAKLAELEFQIPNLPHESVPGGEDESDNVVVREWGEKPERTDVPPHWEIAEALGLIDPARGVKIAGSGFMLYTGMGARLQRALINFMLDHHGRRGYTEIFPPYVANADSLTGTGQLPKFEDDQYKTTDGLYLIPTAEVPVTNIRRDEIIDGAELPLRCCAFSSCFRKEAGAAGKDTRGLQRMHQFEKVELVKLTDPESSYDELESLTSDAASILEALGLHHRVTLLCAPEMSFSNAKCYDLEIWSPAMQKYLEVSSCSNFEAFQARRANIRFRRKPGEPVEFVHTLNGSGVALPRLIAVLLETYWQPDGTVEVPAVLQAALGTDRLGGSLS